MSHNVTNEEYIELVQAVVDELRPDQPVTVVVTKFKDPHTNRFDEKIALKLDVVRGPETSVLINKGDILGMGELPLRSFIIDKLVAIGVHATSAPEDIARRVLDAPEKPTEATEAEAAKVREMLAKRRPVVVVTPSQQVDLTPIIATEVENNLPNTNFFKKEDPNE